MGLNGGDKEQALRSLLEFKEKGELDELTHAIALILHPKKSS